MLSPISKLRLPLLSSAPKIYYQSRSFAVSATLLRRSAEPTIPNTPIKIFRDVPALRQWRRKQLVDYRTVGLVPTMGALHAVSIYVNPTQFGVHEDLDSYPKTWDADCKLLRDLDRELAENGNMGKIAAVFAPTTETMYPSGRPSQAVNAKGSFVTITPVGELLEGASRPTFFRGVATVCMKLFNIVMPENVYFGQKDVQQTVVIKKMVKDFCMDTKVVVGETQREPDGLAMSSRNVYLGTRRRAVATALSNMLKIAENAYNAGDRSRDNLLGPALEHAKKLLMIQQELKPEERVKFEVDYISLADPETMEEINVADETKGAILSGAIKMLPVESPQEGEDLGAAGGPPVRLIDNIILKPVNS
ncbi:pantoate-beta-alanine ligase [Clarireedia jacksonii]